MNRTFLGDTSAESAILTLWRGLYPELRRRRRGRPLHYMLHAPLSPYRFAPQDIRVSLIKDSHARFMGLAGYDVVSVPVWDPYAPGTETPEAATDELTVVWQSYEQQVRILIAEQQQRLIEHGILADWDAAERASFPRQDGKVFGLLRQLQESGYLVHMDAPGHWCIQCQTVLSSDELEFQQVETEGIFVLFPVHAGLEAYGSPLFLFAYLREPWLLPGISTITVQNEQRYAVVEVDGKQVIVPMVYLEAGDETERFVCLSDAEVIAELPATALATCTCLLPSQGIELPVILVREHLPAHITAIAPAHSFRDHVLTRHYGVEIRSVLDEQGYLTDDAQTFCAVHVEEADYAALFELKRCDYLMHQEAVQELQPHCWACGSRVYFCVAGQWLLKPDGGASRRRLTNAFATIQWDDESSSERIHALMSDSHDWSVARRRLWGIPLPVMYCTECGNVLSPMKIGRNVRDLATRRGLQSWFTEDVTQWLGSDVTCSQCGASSFTTERDVLRTDFSSVLHQIIHQANYARGGGGSACFAEPLSRYAGWFAIWLLVAAASASSLPVKKLYVYDTAPSSDHEPPVRLRSDTDIEADSLDTLRLAAICEWSIEQARDYRGTFITTFVRLSGIDHAEATSPLIDEPVSQALLQRMETIQRRVGSAYESLDFNRVVEQLAHFCRDDLLAFYLPLVEPLCAEEGKTACAVHAALHQVRQMLLFSLAPIMPLLAEQEWQRQGHDTSLFLETWEGFNPFPPESEERPPVEDGSRWKTLRSLHTELARLLSERQGIPCWLFPGPGGDTALLEAYCALLSLTREQEVVCVTEPEEPPVDGHPLESIPGGRLKFGGG